MRNALAALVLLAASAATAQTGISLELENQRAELRLSGGSCDQRVVVTWAAPAVTYCSALKIWATTQTCGEQPAAGDLTFATVSQATVQSQLTGTASFLVRELPIFGTTACGAPGLEETVDLCASAEYVANGFGCSDVFLNQNESRSVHYDANPPAVPTITGVTPLDGALELAVELPEGATVVYILYSLAGGAETEAGPFTPDTIRIDRLENGQTYDFRAVAADEVDNRSEPSAVVQGTPVLTFGFFERYREAGGAEDGGCAATGGDASLVGVAFAALAAFWRRRR